MSRAPAAGTVVALCGALCGALFATSGRASPDGADWAVADKQDGCRSCHLADESAPESSLASPPEPPRESSPESPALSLTGLPQHPEPGRDYRLTVTLADPLLKNAGFLLTVRAAGKQTGEFAAEGDARVETRGAQARSTYDGSFVATPGHAEWQVVWSAPNAFDGTLSFELWGNAGNRDLSPLEDRVYRGSWMITP